MVSRTHFYSSCISFRPPRLIPFILFLCCCCCFFILHTRLLFPIRVLLFLISCMFLSLMLFSSLLFTCLLIFFLFFASYLSNRLSLEPLFFFLHTHSAPTLDRFFRYRKLSTFEPVTLVHFGGMLWLQAVHVGCECVCVHLCVSACFHLWACGSGKAFI